MLIEAYRKTIETCRFCHMCKIACTVGNITKNESNYPRGKALILFTILQKRREWDEDTVERIYQCDICGLCKDWCISDYDIPELIIAARADIVNSGKITTRFSEIYKNIKKTGNPYPIVTNNDELKIVIDKKKSKIGKRTETMYFIDGTTFYHPEIVKATIKILNYAEIEFTILYKENSHIKLLYQLGFWKEAEKLAKENTKIINEADCEMIIISDADEYLAFKRDYSKLGASLNSNIKIMHLSEYISLLLQKNKLSFSKEINKTVTYHDPSALGRYLKVYEAPRQIIKAVPGVKFKEMRWNKNKAHCCGASGGLLFTNPEIATKAAEKIIEEAIEIEAEIILTASPLCKQSLINCKRPKSSGIKIYDIIEFAAKSL